VLAFAAAMKRVARPSELTPDDIKVLSGWGDPQDLAVRSYRLVGEWGAAIIEDNAPAPLQGPPPMGCISVFRYESSRWTLFDQSSFIGEIDLFPRLRSESRLGWGAPHAHSVRSRMESKGGEKVLQVWRCLSSMAIGALRRTVTLPITSSGSHAHGLRRGPACAAGLGSEDPSWDAPP
jgi:hypothetical protein